MQGRFKREGRYEYLQLIWVSLGSSAGKESACNAGDLGSIPGMGRSPGGGHDNSFQCFCLENPMDRGAWWATVHGVTKSQTKILEWVAISFSRGSSRPRDGTQVSRIAGRYLNL